MPNDRRGGKLKWGIFNRGRKQLASLFEIYLVNLKWNKKKIQRKYPDVQTKKSARVKSHIFDVFVFSRSSFLLVSWAVEDHWLAESLLGQIFQLLWGCWKQGHRAQTRLLVSWTGHCVGVVGWPCRYVAGGRSGNHISLSPAAPVSAGTGSDAGGDLG